MSGWRSGNSSGRLGAIEERLLRTAMDKEQIEQVNRALAPWMPARRIHRHLVMALIGLGMIPFLRPDMHMEYLLLAWLALPFASPSP